MTDYRAVLRHAKYWRGNVHRWSTSYEFTGSGVPPDGTACDTLKAAEEHMLYSPTTAPFSAGVAEAAFYLASGGTPIVEKIYYDWTQPSAWIAPSSDGWPVRTVALENLAETALLVEWQGGLSRTGKPVKFRKFYHSVPFSQGTGSSGDISGTTQTALVARANALTGCLGGTYGLALGNASRLAGTASVSLYYVTHQMPRGRRRKPLVTASGKYTGPNIPIIISPPEGE